MIGMQLDVKIKTEHLFGMFLNMRQSKCISSLTTVEEWKQRWMTNSDIQKTCIKSLEKPCMFSVPSEHEKMLHRFEKYVEDILLK